MIRGSSRGRARLHPLVVLRGQGIEGGKAGRSGRAAAARDANQPELGPETDANSGWFGQIGQRGSSRTRTASVCVRIPTLNRSGSRLASAGGAAPACSVGPPSLGALAPQCRERPHGRPSVRCPNPARRCELCRPTSALTKSDAVPSHLGCSPPLLLREEFPWLQSGGPRNPWASLSAARFRVEGQLTKAPHGGQDARNDEAASSVEIA